MPSAQNASALSTPVMTAHMIVDFIQPYMAVPNADETMPSLRRMSSPNKGRSSRDSVGRSMRIHAAQMKAMKTTSKPLPTPMAAPTSPPATPWSSCGACSPIMEASLEVHAEKRSASVDSTSMADASDAPRRSENCGR